MIIHNDADIYSACDALIEGAWSHYGLVRIVYLDKGVDMLEKCKYVYPNSLPD